MIIHTKDETNQVRIAKHIYVEILVIPKDINKFIGVYSNNSFIPFKIIIYI